MHLMTELYEEGALSARGGLEMVLRDALWGEVEGLALKHLTPYRGQEAAAGPLEGLAPPRWTSCPSPSYTFVPSLLPNTFSGETLSLFQRIVSYADQ